MATIEEQIAAELQKQHGGEVKTETPVVETKVETPVVETKTETPVVTEAVIETPVVETKVEAPVIETKVEPVVVKSFEEQLKERSKGKFEKWEDIEAGLTPKEVFANEKIKHLNDLAAKGIDVTSREFLELQSIDFEKINRTDDILFEKWKRSDEGRGLPDDVIRHEINKKYNVDAWIDKDDADLTVDDKANQAKMLRDAGESKQWLVNYKNERVLEKQVDPKVQEAMAEEQKATLAKWEKYVESDLLNKITKYTTPIVKDGKTVGEFNYDISDQDKAEVGAIVKGLPKDTNVFFNQFFKTGEDGKVKRDDVALIDMMLKARNYDKAVALAYSDGAAKEALRIEKESKNTNFKPNETGAPVKVHTSVNDALAEQVNKMKI